ncbi:protein translocase subunit SecD [Chitinimonas sp.]|uniref:protein translocase subunit SecD n=1 Tax=Chitinimonas sp. TaxID=1934313 RepID=UPI0035B3116F
MNRYPLWKYLLIILAVIAGFIYSVPNLYGESPAIQISAVHSGNPVSNDTLGLVQKTLADAKLVTTGVKFDGKSVLAKLQDVESQTKARELVQHALGDEFVVALNTISNTPPWFASVGAHPMARGLDLRGGVHFLMEVDMAGALQKNLERVASEVRRSLREEKVRYGSIKPMAQSVDVQLRDAETVAAARKVLEKSLPNMQITLRGESTLQLSFSAAELQKLQADAVAQNVSSLQNRVNELGVAEPLIQQQGANRIVVELPGMDDSTRAKNIIGRVATLEIRMADHDPAHISAAINGEVPAGYELMEMSTARGSGGQKILVKKEVELTGENINRAQPSFDQQGSPVISMSLDSAGAGIFRQLTRENVGKPMAIVLKENGKGQVLTAPRINGELGAQFVIEGGGMTVEEANDISILIRSGALAAPMTFAEERVVGPSLGAENIKKGFDSTLYGFAAITIFMVIYYRVFGVTAAVALAANLLFLIACLSKLGVTMTLPGIAAIALTLGMAIDSNVLINERIREEVRAGMPPQSAIKAGYEHAWATILDSNITTLIAGLALLIFGSGAIRGFAWVHCLGIVTSMFSSVFVSRGVVNLIYGYRRKVKSLAV